MLSLHKPDGTPINSVDEIFNTLSGSVETANFRLYNNFSGSTNVPDVIIDSIFVSVLSGTKRIGDIQYLYSNVTTLPIIYETLSGTCVSSAKLSGSNPSIPMKNATQDFNDPQYDYIPSSGTYNYNEYQLTVFIDPNISLNIKSGTLYLNVKYHEILI